MDSYLCQRHLHEDTSRIWTRVADSISDVDNRYTNHASLSLSLSPKLRDKLSYIMPASGLIPDLVYNPMSKMDWLYKA